MSTAILAIDNDVARPLSFFLEQMNGLTEILILYLTSPSSPTEQLLTNNQTLENLSLQHCLLDDDDDICSLAKGLEHFKLKKLDLWGNHFTTRGATALYCVLKNHPTLTKEMVILPDNLKWSQSYQ